MADSLFDNRYRYDFIYPRGRSGETLRAVDTQNKDRLVVIKRPAPNDAPPIRAGQEVSIINERKALRRLAGHPVLCALLAEGSFTVGGMMHQYIVLERAQGLIIGEAVHQLKAQGEYLPELETLVIIDHLLDLIHTAHIKDIVYNDIDAKHLFWNREKYQLKVIDWGNAVFLEGDAVTPQGISRQTDVYQTGELMYFIFTGGRRAEVPRDAGPDFVMDFGESGRRIPTRLQAIISRALHPNTRHRYQAISDLRAEVHRYREPIERERNLTVISVTDKLRRANLSKNELRSLKLLLEPALNHDPGYPPAREAYEDIENRLRDLNVEADLDAVRIYMTSGNWASAAKVLGDLRERGGTQTAGLIAWLNDTANILLQASPRAISSSIQRAIELMFSGQATQAAAVLLTRADEASGIQPLQWQIAERISSHIPDVLLLRPNLFRLQQALRQLTQDGFDVTEPRTLLTEVEKTVERLGQTSTNIPGLRDGYREVVEQLITLNPLLQTNAAKYQLPYESLPLNSLDRALNAAMALADGMHVIGKQAAASPRDALNALDANRAIDPTNPAWVEVEDLLERLYNILQTCQKYVPNAEGTDLQDWLTQTHQTLAPFAEHLFDEMLLRMIDGLEIAANRWQVYRNVVINGNREGAVGALETAEQTVATLSPSLANWLRQLRGIINSAQYIERHSVPGAFGRAIADGWQDFDRGRLADAERLGMQAYEHARTEAEQFAATRLQELAQYTRDWVERNGISNPSRTQALLSTIEGYFTPDERAVLDDFTAQMPSIDTYLKAMSKGLVAVYRQRSTAALRLLFLQYVMLGTLDTHEGRLEDAAFWREAAIKALGEAGERHVATRTLDEFLARRQDLNSASALLNRLADREILPELDSIRRQLENNPQARLLASGIQSVRDLETGLRTWADGEFRGAGLKLESALKGVSEVEQAASLTLTRYRAWLLELLQTAADLHVQQRELRASIDQRPDTPTPRLHELHHHLAQTTQQVLNADLAATLRQWYETYDAFEQAYNADERRSKRLERMNELFRAMFIDRHPAYLLYRHWYNVLDASPEFPAPPTNDPTPRIAADATIPEEEYRGTRYRDDNISAPAGRRGGRRWIMGLLLLLIVAGAGAFALSQASNTATSGITITISPTIENTTTADETNDETTTAADVAQATSATPTSPSPTFIPTLDPVASGMISATPSPTTTPSATPTPITPSATPTDTPTPTATSTPPPATNTPLPPQGAQGNQDLLALFSRSASLPFNPELFAPIEGGWRMGTGVATGGDVLTIRPPDALLEEAFGNNASTRIRSVEAELTLRTFNPAVVGNDEVYFGLLLVSVEDGNNVGLRVDVVGPTIINLSQVRNNGTAFLNQRSVNAVIARIRLDRDRDSGAVTIFYNDNTIGQPIAFINPDAPVMPVLFVKEGGVIIGVSDWRINLR